VLEIKNQKLEVSENGRVVSVKKFITLYPIDRGAIYRMLRSGRLPFKRLGRKILIDLDVVEKTMSSK